MDVSVFSTDANGGCDQTAITQHIAPLVRGMVHSSVGLLWLVSVVRTKRNASDKRNVPKLAACASTDALCQLKVELLRRVILDAANALLRIEPVVFRSK